MDKYKFRGKRIEDGKWVYGDLIHEPYGTVIQDYIIKYPKGAGAPERQPEKVRRKTKVDPETVGQFVGRYDTKEIPFYEGDIYEYDNDSYYYGRTDLLPVRLAVIYNIEDLYTNGDSDLLDYHFYEDPKIIGNIHDNPELIENKRRMCGLRD
jgi:uncharacterized phage protein (TIGR01671 family)